LSHLFLRGDFDSGDRVEFAPSFVHPLGNTELRLLHKTNVAVELQLDADGITINGERKTEQMHARATITFREPPTVFALVRGGWLPPPFAMPPNFLVDQNVVIALRKLRQGQISVNRQQVEWWFKIFESSSAMFNPLPYAFEAEFRRKPTIREFIKAYDEGVSELKKSFPNCKVVSYQSAIYEAAYAQLEAFDEANAAQTNFLIQTCKLVRDRVPRQREGEVLREILAVADSLRIPRASPVVLAVASCLFEDFHGSIPSIGRQIIKPKRNYSVADAFNAINDLRHIELAAASQTYFGENAFHLCTCDRAVAMLWCALSLRGESSTRGSIEMTFDLTSDLFARLSNQEILEVKELLAA
jgi:hypothetical protein